MFIARGIPRIPDHIWLEVEERHKRGSSHQEIFEGFNTEEDQRFAAIALSMMIEPADRRRYRWLNRALAFLLALMMLGAIIEIRGGPDLVPVLIFGAILVMVLRRSAWGYNAALLLGAWSMLGTLLVPFWRSTPEDFFYGIFGLVYGAAMFAIAHRLRKKLFPWMRILGIKVNEDGAPLIAKELLERRDAREAADDGAKS